MYKIYINDKPLILLASTEVETHLYKSKNAIIAKYIGKTKFLLNYIDTLEKPSNLEYIAIHHDDLSLLLNDFKSLFEIIVASGGLVYNDKGQYLFIFRNGVWDLPKGKLESGEKKKQAATREVMEECGIQQVELKEKIIITFHTFKNKKGIRVLKMVHWYLMHSNDIDLVPQKKEGIKKVKWMKSAKFLKGPNKSYATIYEVLLYTFKHIPDTTAKIDHADV